MRDVSAAIRRCDEALLTLPNRYDIALPNGYFNLAIERNKERHAVGRRAIAKDYTLAATLKNEKYFDNVIHDFITALDKNFASVGKICDFTVGGIRRSRSCMFF